MKTNTILIIAAIGLVGYYFYNKNNKEETRPPDLAPPKPIAKPPFVRVISKPITNAIKITETQKR